MAHRKYDPISPSRGDDEPVENTRFEAIETDDFSAVKNEGRDDTPLAVDATRTVEAINLTVVNGRMLVYDVDHKSDVWWVPIEHVRFSKAQQRVSLAVLKDCERPYDWNSELESLVVTVDDVRLMLYYLNYHTPQTLDVKKVVADLLRVGKLPIVKRG